MKTRMVVWAAVLAGTAAFGGDFTVERIFRPARHVRGNTNIARLQPIDEASWIWMPGDEGPGWPKGDFWKSVRIGKPDGKPLRLMKFECAFDVAKGDGDFEIDVSGDERFVLELDGRFVSRGPHRGTVENWQYQSYKVRGLESGAHKATAYVWSLGASGPLAQLTHRGGFILKASGKYDAKLSTGKAKWRVGRLEGMKHAGHGGGAWGTGTQFTIEGRGPCAGEPKKWLEAETVRGPAVGNIGVGARTGGWMLFPSQLPDQMNAAPADPGAFRAAHRPQRIHPRHPFSKEDCASPDLAPLNALLREGKPFTIPPNTRLQAALDLGRYTCAYPVLKTAAGAQGAKIAWSWTESTRESGSGYKNDRSKILNKYVDGMTDTFICDGGAGDFSTPWFRCGRWCRIDVTTGDSPLEITALGLKETRYPLENESEFQSPQAEGFDDIRRICTRAMQMCCHEMLFDCPFYEQQMYPGDTRVQLLVLGAMTRDDRMIKRAIELYDLATRDDGMCPMNWPTKGLQESGTYTLCYLCMFGDYAMNHADRQWLRARIPGLRKSMAGIEYYENADGLIAGIPGWSFMDWPPSWRGGMAPGSRGGDGLNAEINLFWSLAMRSASIAERALGNELQARYWDEKRERLNAKIVEKFWNESRGILSDDTAKKHHSEHSQALAIVADALPAGKLESVARHLAEDGDLTRCTVYFTYYLFEAYFKIGRADLFLDRLGLWREYVKKGVTTVLESPESGKMQARSDCHAWGSHPLVFMETGLAGVRPAAPFYEKVLVAPQPGRLKDVKASVPHPKGFVKVDLHFDGGAAYGTVETPVPGVFRFGGETVELVAGKNEIPGKQK